MEFNEEIHREYRAGLQHILGHLKNGDTNIQSELHDLEWNLKNDRNRLEILGKDAFEDEYDALEKFIEAVEAIKEKFHLHYTVDETTFDDADEEEEEDEMSRAEAFFHQYFEDPEIDNEGEDDDFPEEEEQ